MNVHIDFSLLVIAALGGGVYLFWPGTSERAGRARRIGEIVFFCAVFAFCTGGLNKVLHP